MKDKINKKTTLGALLFLAPILALVALIIHRGSDQTPALPSTGWKPVTDTNPDYKKALAQWSSETFVPIVVNTKSLNETVRTIAIHSEGLSLTPTQREQLLKSVSSLLLAFSSGSLEDYFQFRAPVREYQYNVGTIDALRKELAARYCRKGEQLPSQPDEVFRLYWQRCYGGHAFSNYWNGISIENSGVWVERGRSVSENLAIYALHAANAGVADIAPVITLEPKPEKILKEQGELLYATVSLLIKARPPEPAHPIHCRLYWVAERSKWLPSQLVSSYVGPREVQIVF